MTRPALRAPPSSRGRITHHDFPHEAICPRHSDAVTPLCRADCPPRSAPQWIAILCRACTKVARSNGTVDKSTGAADVAESLLFLPLAGRCNQCSRRGNYGSERVDRRYCGKHRGPGDRVKTTQWCQAGMPTSHTGDKKWKRLSGEENRLLCHKQPVYGEAGGRATFCLDHKQEHHMDLRNPRCKHAGCKKRAVYGETIDSRATMCFSHKSPLSVDSVHKRCRWTPTNPSTHPCHCPAEKIADRLLICGLHTAMALACNRAGTWRGASRTLALATLARWSRTSARSTSSATTSTSRTGGECLGFGVQVVEQPSRGRLGRCSSSVTVHDQHPTRHAIRKPVTKSPFLNQKLRKQMPCWKKNLKATMIG